MYIINNNNLLNYLFIDSIIKVIIKFLDFKVLIDDIVNFKCIFDGNLNLNYMWKFNNIEIWCNVKYNIFVDWIELLFIVINIIDNGYY